MSAPSRIFAFAKAIVSLLTRIAVAAEAILSEMREVRQRVENLERNNAIAIPAHRFREMMEISETTYRHWVSLGLPTVKIGDGRNTRPFVLYSDAVEWVRKWRHTTPGEATLDSVLAGSYDQAT